MHLITAIAPNDKRSAIADGLAGGQAAFEGLVRENQRMIHSLCYRLTGSLEDAEDLAQETFVQAAQHLGEFRGDAKVSSWLYRIAVNRCLNWRRHRQRQERTLEEWSRAGSEPAKDNDPRSGQIQEALMKLPVKQRAAVALVIYDGLNHAEAAGVLGCSETTVSWRLFAARRKLKKLLKTLHPGGAK